MPGYIEDDALIGYCETAALVGRDGSIDWLCWPRFDSDACFAALVGKPSNGRWLITPSDDVIEVTRLKGGALRAIAGPDMVVLRAPVTLWGENFKTAAMFTVAKGDTRPFVLSYGPSHLSPPEPVDCHTALTACEKFWRDWAAETNTDGPYADAIRRSLITLKALTYVPSGGIVAAPTTSLPEQPGGARNWDYRYCWIRDSTLTLLALMNAGVFAEATAWRDWLQRAVA